MSIRITALYIFVAFLSTYAWKDWFKSLCGLILLMAIIEHGDMPKNLFNIQGLNVWNVLFLVIVLAWITNRRREGLTWDMPRHVTILLLMYLSVILVGTLRAYLDPGYITWYPFRRLISDELINTIKWVLPGVLLFDGCRTRKQVFMVLVCLLALYFLIGFQVVRNMPPESVLSDSGGIDKARRKLDDLVGYAATDISVMLAGGFWGILAATSLYRKRIYQIMLIMAGGIVAFGVAETGGRGGYVALGGAGLVMCLVKWRRYLLLAPVAVILLPIILPGATARMLKGFNQTDMAGQETINEEDLASGRLTIWPYVVDKIGESPWLGYGRLAMKRTGLSYHLGIEYPGIGAPHPHNMYLETLLDNGILGSIPILSFFALIVLYSVKMFRSKNSLLVAVGGLSLGLILTSLIAGLVGQHIYPQEHTLGIWAAMFLLLRVYVEEKRAQTVNVSVETSWGNPPYEQQQVPFIPAY